MKAATIELSPLELEIEDLEQKLRKLNNAIELVEFKAPEGVVIESDNDFYQKLKAGLESDETREQALKIKAIAIEEIEKLESELRQKKEALKTEKLKAELENIRNQMVEKGGQLNAILEQIDPIFKEMESLTAIAQKLSCDIKPYAQEPGQGLDQFRYYAKKKLFRVEATEGNWVECVDYPKVGVSNWISATPALKEESSTKIIGMQRSGLEPFHGVIHDARRMGQS